MTVPIPYAGPPPARMRVLELRLRRGLLGANAATVGLDGHTYVLPWGMTYLEVPADRPVSVGVHQEARRTVGQAAVVLAPGQPAVLEYRGPAHLSQPGELGAPGTVRSRGLGLQVVLLTVLGLVLLVAAALVALVVAAIL